MQSLAEAFSGAALAGMISHVVAYMELPQANIHLPSVIYGYR